MKKEKLGRKLGALALSGIIASVTLLPCAVNAAESVKNENTSVVSGESTTKKVKKHGKKAR